MRSCWSTYGTVILPDSMLTPRLCKTARTLLDVQQKELAEKARVNLRTLMDFERGARDTHPRTISAIQDALEEMGIEFLNHGAPGVRLHRKRAEP